MVGRRVGVRSETRGGTGGSGIGRRVEEARERESKRVRRRRSSVRSLDREKSRKAGVAGLRMNGTKRGSVCAGRHELSHTLHMHMKSTHEKREVKDNST